MKTFAKFFLISLLLIMAVPAYSDTDGQVIQIFICEFNDDATSDQVLEMTAEWLKAARAMDGGENIQVGIRFPIAEGPPLCVVEDFAYETRYRDLVPGQWVCVITDGVTEAMNRARELFGVARVTEALQSIPEGADVGGILRHVHERVVAYVGDAAVADDLTLLVLRWNGPISAFPIEDEEADLADVDLDTSIPGLGDPVRGRHQ